MRRIISVLVKAGMSGLLLWLALGSVDVRTVAGRLSQIQPGWIVLGFVAMLAQQAILAGRWRMLLRACGGDFSFRKLLRLTMIGVFFSQTLPSSVGGDAMRIWLLGKLQNWRVAGYSVLLDRVVGVVVLALIVVACFPWTLDLVRDPTGRGALLFIGIGSIGIGMLFLTLSSPRLHVLQRWSPARHLASVAKVAADLVRSPAQAAPILAISVTIHLFSVLSAWLIAQAVGADLSLTNALFVVLPVILIAAVPISIAGWGVREGAMVVAFGFAGLPQSDGLAVSILIGGVTLAVGAVGGLIWVFYDRKNAVQSASPPAVKMEA